MTRDELLKRLQIVKSRAILALSLLEVPENGGSETEIRDHIEWLRNELRDEFLRTSPEKIQRGMTIFERSVYAPTIEEAWKQSGISRLKIEAPPARRWTEAIEAVVYTSGKYLR